MSLASLVPFLLLAAASPVPKVCTPDPPRTFSQTGAEAYLRRAEADWAASVADDEAAYLLRVAAENFMGVLGGKVLDRPALIAEAEKRGQGAASDTLEDVWVHLSGSTPVAEGVELWTHKTPMTNTSRVVGHLGPLRWRLALGDIHVGRDTDGLGPLTSLGTGLQGPLTGGEPELG